MRWSGLHRNKAPYKVRTLDRSIHQDAATLDQLGTTRPDLELLDSD